MNGTKWVKLIKFLLHTEFTAQKMKFPIQYFFSKCEQIRSFLERKTSFFVQCKFSVYWNTLLILSFLRICSYLPKKSLMENFIFCAVTLLSIYNFCKWFQVYFFIVLALLSEVQYLLKDLTFFCYGHSENITYVTELPDLIETTSTTHPPRPDDLSLYGKKFCYFIVFLMTQG